MNTPEKISLHQLTKDLNEMSKAFALHAQADAEHQQDMKELIERIGRTLEPISRAYSGFLFSKSFLVGLSSVILAIGAIGAGIIWAINAAIGR